MNVEGSKIKTYEYDPQILYLCQQQQKQYKTNKL